MPPHIPDNRFSSISNNDEDDDNREYSCCSPVTSESESSSCSDSSSSSSSTSIEYNSHSESIAVPVAATSSSSLPVSSDDSTIVNTLPSVDDTVSNIQLEESAGQLCSSTCNISFSRVTTTISPPRSRNGNSGSHNNNNSVVFTPIALTSNKSSAKIRSQLLNRLGISNTQKELLKQQNNTLSNNNNNNRSYDSTVSILGKDLTSKSYEELIKADNGKPDVFLLVKYKLQKQTQQQQQQSQIQIQIPNDQVVKGGNMKIVYSKNQSNNESNTKDTTNTMMKKKMMKNDVRFDVAVKVHTIPNRIEYSDRIRATLWTDPIEMQQNAARNTIEYAAEGWDWTQVANDNDMILMNNGERIHPVHFIHSS